MRGTHCSSGSPLFPWLHTPTHTNKLKAVLRGLTYTFIAGSFVRHSFLFWSPLLSLSVLLTKIPVSVSVLFPLYHSLSCLQSPRTGMCSLSLSFLFSLPVTALTGRDFPSQAAGAPEQQPLVWAHWKHPKENQAQSSKLLNSHPLKLFSWIYAWVVVFFFFFLICVHAKSLYGPA